MREILSYGSRITCVFGHGDEEIFGSVYPRSLQDGFNGSRNSFNGNGKHVNVGNGVFVTRTKILDISAADASAIDGSELHVDDYESEFEKKNKRHV